MAYQKGQSGNPAGRVKGSMNKTTALIKNSIPEILEAVITQAKQGDLQAAAIILSRGLRPLKAAHEPIRILTAPQLEAMSPAERADAVNTAALAGKLPADVAAALLDGIAKGCAIVESTTLAAEVAAMKAAMEKQNGGHGGW